MRSRKIIEIAALGALTTYLFLTFFIVSFFCVFARLDTAHFQSWQAWGAEEGKEKGISDAGFEVTNERKERLIIQLLHK